MANPTLKTKMGNKQNHKQTRYNENKWLTEWAAILPKRWSLSNPNRTKSIINNHKVKHHRNSDTKNRQQRTTSEQALERSVMNYWGGLN